jgi:hypothetical protein
MGGERDAEEEVVVEEVEEEEEEEVVVEEEEEEEVVEAAASDKRPDLRVEMHCIFSAVWPSPTRKCVEGSCEAVEPGAVGTQDVLFRRIN